MFLIIIKGQCLSHLGLEQFNFALMYLKFFLSFQAFINTAKEIYEKIQEGVFDINNEVIFEEEAHSLFIICF